MNISRKIKMKDNYKPLPVNKGDEIFPNGIFHFNISRIMEHINSGELKVETEQIDVKQWFKFHNNASVNEEYLQIVDIKKPVIQAEIRPNMFEIIDGNHRMEKAFREGVELIDSYKLNGEKLLTYFIDERGYRAYVEYWNSKL